MNDGRGKSGCGGMIEQQIVAAGEPNAEQREREKQSFLLLVLTVFAVAVCLYVAREVCLPITLAILLAVVLSPLVRGMRKLCIPEPLGAAAIMLLLLGGIGYGTYTLAVPAADWAHQMPSLVGQAHSRLSGLLGPLHEMQQAGQSMSTLTDPAAPQPAAPAVSQAEALPDR
jgi:predicted PurR-regulated permease PerM